MYQRIQAVSYNNIDNIFWDRVIGVDQIPVKYFDNSHRADIFIFNVSISTFKYQSKCSAEVNSRKPYSVIALDGICEALSCFGFKYAVSSFRDMGKNPSSQHGVFVTGFKKHVGTRSKYGLCSWPIDPDPRCNPQPHLEDNDPSLFMDRQLVFLLCLYLLLSRWARRLFEWPAVFDARDSRDVLGGRGGLSGVN